MRIVAGQYGGRRLEVPKGRDIRPTSDKVRGAIFNALRSRSAVESAHVLDAFCGTGALGLEALSQGAASCTFMDKSRDSMELAKRNAASLGVVAEFILRDAAKINEGSYDLVFLDPPYNQDLITPVLEALLTCLKPNAVIVCEAEKNWSGVIPAAYKILDKKIYGDTKVVFLAYENIPE